MAPTRIHRAVAAIAAVALVVAQMPGALVAQSTKPASPPPTPPKTATAQPAAKPAASPSSATQGNVVDGGWPRSSVTASGAQLTIYQPQVATWDGRQHMVAYSAVSYLVKGKDKPALGTVKLEADTTTSVDTRLVKF